MTRSFCLATQKRKINVKLGQTIYLKLKLSKKKYETKIKSFVKAKS
jgi:uncharacterized protein Veg